MAEPINESISVTLWSNHKTRIPAPYSFYWHGRRYAVATVGMHHAIREGRRLFHIFSVSDGANFFKLIFDTETLGWKLLEADTGSQV